MYEVYQGEALTLAQSKELFQLCFQEAKYFTLSVYSNKEPAYKSFVFHTELEERLNPYCIGTKHIKKGRWGNRGIDETNPFDPGIKLKVFEVTPETTTILQEFYDTIYLEYSDDVQASYNNVKSSKNIIVNHSSLTDIFFLDEQRKVMVETLPWEGTVGIYEDNKVLLDFVHACPEKWFHWEDDSGFRDPVQWDPISNC